MDMGVRRPRCPPGYQQQTNPDGNAGLVCVKVELRLPSARAMKRFKAVVIGGTGYGGAEMIRRLLIHPDVELTRVVAVDHVGEPLGAVHPPLTGRSDAAVRERARPPRRPGARTSRCSACRTR